MLYLVKKVTEPSGKFEKRLESDKIRSIFELLIKVSIPCSSNLFPTAKRWSNISKMLLDISNISKSKSVGGGDYRGPLQDEANSANFLSFLFSRKF